MASATLVTIVLTTLNSERYVARSIDSCLSQTHQDLELIVVDGGSRDRTLGIVHSFKDPRIRVVHQQDNVGKLPGAINLGMANARGGFITWTQDDSWYAPVAIESMLGYLSENAKTALVYTDYWEVNAQGERIRYQAVNPPEHILVDDVVRVCFLFRRTVYETIGPQQTKYFPVHEVPWRIQVAKHFRIDPWHHPLMSYTVHAHSLTGRIGGWNLERLTLEALYEEGHVDRRTYRRRRAKIDMDQGYSDYVLNRQYRSFWLHVVSGVRRDPTWLTNVGIWKLAIMSLSPNRESYRDKLYDLWKSEDEAKQSELIQKYLLQSGQAT